MPDILATLDSYYRHALENSGTDEFYTFLYKYIQAIKQNERLSGAVNDFWVKQLSEDFRATDNETFKKALMSYLAEHGLSSKQADSLSDFQRFEVMWKMLAANGLWSTKPYACWFVLYSHFYSKVEEDLDVLQSIVPISSVYNQADYSTALKVFHADFMIWLSENADTSSIVAPQNVKVASVSHDQPDDILNLSLSGKSLWLIVNGKQTELIKKFDSKSNNNFKGCRELLRRKGRPLTCEGMGIASKSRITDLPKTMGLVGAIADTFVDVDTENNTITILKDVRIAHDNMAELINSCQSQS